MPRNSNRYVLADREGLRQAFARAAILSNDKLRGVRLSLQPDLLRITANNPEQEEAELRSRDIPWQQDSNRQASERQTGIIGVPVYILCEDKRYERGHKLHKREALKVRRAENPEEEEVRLWEDASVPWPDSWRKHRKP